MTSPYRCLQTFARYRKSDALGSGGVSNAGGTTLEEQRENLCDPRQPLVPQVAGGAMLEWLTVYLPPSSRASHALARRQSRITV
jgi:hypothetical protein